LYTRCTYCGSIYQVDAATLSQAAGQVRCGICEQSFDALKLLNESLPDEPPTLQNPSRPAARTHDLFDADASAVTPGADAHALGVDAEQPLSELTDELEGLVGRLEALAQDRVDGANVELFDDALESAIDGFDEADDDALRADLEIDPDTALESTDDTDDHWITSDPSSEDWFEDDPLEDSGSEPIQGALLSDALDGASGAEQDELSPASALDGQDADTDDGAAGEHDVDPNGADPEPPFLRPEEALHGLGMPSRPRLLVWIAVVTLAVIIAAVQWVHTAREDLVQHPNFGPRLTEVYRLFGVDLHPDWNPEFLRVERTEMVSHPSILGALFLSGVLSNEAPYPLPLPTLRLRMDNRWGDVLAARVFTPADYLRSPRDPEALFNPGERVAIGVEILDPDPEAVGFRVQVCLPADGGERCR
jgi:predicted Zn finger-like uncharacterized protein